MTRVLLPSIISSYFLYISAALSVRMEIDFCSRDAVPSTTAQNKLVLTQHHAAEKPTSQVLYCQWKSHASLVRCLGRHKSSFSQGLRRRVGPQHFGVCARQKNTLSGDRGTVSFVTRVAKLRNLAPPVTYTKSDIISGADGVRTPLSAGSTTVARTAELKRLRVAADSYSRCVVICKFPPFSTVSDDFDRVCTWRRCGYRKRPSSASSYLHGRQSHARALRCPYVNVVDLASMRSPPLSAEEVLRQQHHSQVISIQMRMAALAVKAAAVAERQREHFIGQVARSHQRWSAVRWARNMQKYHALLFFTSWDTLSQALVAALSDLASLLELHKDTPAATGRQEYSVSCVQKDNYEAADERFAKAHCISAEAKEVRRRFVSVAGTGAEGSSDTEWTALSKRIARHNAGTRKSEGLSFILARIIPCWLPITGVRVYNSLVVGQGRRAIEKHNRMLANRKQLRDHERALLLMVNEGIHYGAGHLPTLQIWRIEGGLLVEDDPPSKFPSPVVETSAPSGSHYKTDGIHFTKVFEARGCGPIKLMDLAGGDPEPWRIEEALLLKRARMNQKKRPTEKELRTAGILSAGWGNWSSVSCLNEGARDDVSVWLAQLTTLYQYHALSLLQKRLSFAESQFPEFEEFNLRKFSLTRAKQKGFLSDLRK